jgi:hypothetical protein
MKKPPPPKVKWVLKTQPFNNAKPEKFGMKVAVPTIVQATVVGTGTQELRRVAEEKARHKARRAITAKHGKAPKGWQWKVPS